MARTGESSFCIKARKWASAASRFGWRARASSSENSGRPKLRFMVAIFAFSLPGRKGYPALRSPRNQRVMMRSISKRLRRLEERLVPRKDGLPDLAAILRERFRRPIEQSGQPHVQAPPGFTERGLNLAKILRMRHERRVNASGQTGPQETEPMRNSND